MNYEQAVSKATKLLRLANSNNANEAANAAAAAQAILDRYHIENLAAEYEGAEEPKEDIRDFWDDPLERRNTKSTWRSRLAVSLARANACGMYTRGGNICLVGRPSDVSVVRYLYSYLTREVERLVARDTPGYGKTYANNYRLGVVETVSSMLHRQRKETEEKLRNETVGNNALVRINNAIAKRDEEHKEVRVWMKEHMDLRAGKRVYAQTDYSARERGREAGREIKIAQARGSLQS